MPTTYIVGVTRKNNTKVSQWVGENGYVYDKSEAKQMSEVDAKATARAETDSRWRGVVSKA